jgi:hypothetical protein
LRFDLKEIIPHVIILIPKGGYKKEISPNDSNPSVITH